MSKVIWKYPVPVDDAFELELTEAAEVLTVQVQGRGPQLWVLLDPNAPKERRKFRVVGTGHPIEDAAGLFWIATFQLGALVFHVFRDLTP